MPSKPRSRGDGLAVEGKAAAGEGAGAERQNVGAAARLFEALPIAQEHLEIGEQVVRPEHGLRAAHVGVSGNDGAGVHLREPEQVAHDGAEQRLQVGALFAQPHAGIERDLLIAAAAGVDLVGDVAGALLEFADDQRVDVLVGGALVEAGVPASARICVEGCRRFGRALRRSECRPAPGRARRPASRGYRNRSSGDRSGASCRSARRPRRVRFQSVRPRASFRPSGKRDCRGIRPAPVSERYFHRFAHENVPSLSQRAD